MVLLRCSFSKRSECNLQKLSSRPQECESVVKSCTKEAVRENAKFNAPKISPAHTKPIFASSTQGIRRGSVTKDGTYKRSATLESQPIDKFFDLRKCYTTFQDSPRKHTLFFLLVQVDKNDNRYNISNLINSGTKTVSQ